MISYCVQGPRMKKYVPDPVIEHRGFYHSHSFPPLAANQQGQILNTLTGYTTYGSKDDRGYLRVAVWDNNTKRKQEYKSHRVVADAFLGPLPDGMEVGHNDDVRSNNKPSNLYYTDRKENMARVHLKRLKEKGGVSKSDIIEIEKSIGDNIITRHITLNKFSKTPSKLLFDKVLSLLENLYDD